MLYSAIFIGSTYKQFLCSLATVPRKIRIRNGNFEIIEGVYTLLFTFDFGDFLTVRQFVSPYKLPSEGFDTFMQLELI